MNDYGLKVRKVLNTCFWGMVFGGMVLCVGILIKTSHSSEGNISEQREHDSIIVDKNNTSVSIAAIFHPSHFNRNGGLKQHHFIVWEKGKAARNALFTTFAPDSAVYNALISIGAIAGNNLTQATWDKRNNPSSPEPDKKTEGSAISIGISFQNNTYTPAMILIDNNKKQYDFRFAGNYALIPIWKSGCVACLQSCPGGKIGNRTYSIRDLVNQIPRFSVVPGTGIKEGDTVIIVFSVKPTK
jgi:hypothetical protein